MRIAANTDICVGAGMCVLTAPDMFDQDDVGLVVVREGEPAAERHAVVRQAVHLCPSGALTLVGDS